MNALSRAVSKMAFAFATLIPFLAKGADHQIAVIGRYSFYVSDKQLEKCPQWVCDGVRLPPLSFLDAYQKGLQAVRKQHPKVATFQLRGMGLERVTFSGWPDRWYYQFDFVAGGTDEELYKGYAFPSIVLLDGSLAEVRTNAK